MEYIATRARKYNRLKIKGSSEMNFIKVNTKNSKAKDAYTKARDEHNAAIASLKQQRKEARKAIKLHRLLKRQARNLYKITKLEP